MSERLEALLAENRRALAALYHAVMGKDQDKIDFALSVAYLLAIVGRPHSDAERLSKRSGDSPSAVSEGVNPGEPK